MPSLTRHRLWILTSVLLALLCTLPGMALEPFTEGASTFTHWQDLPESPVKRAFETKGTLLANNLQLVAMQSGKPVLIRGGGFSKAGVDWLVLEMGVRTIIDLRGKFVDDRTNQILAQSNSIVAAYRKHNDLDHLKNLSPEELGAYVKRLNNAYHLDIKLFTLRAEDPKIATLLDSASPQRPLAMFCQHGVNRSGTAWAAWATQKGWPKEKTQEVFGVKYPGGRWRNTRDIDYGYTIGKKRS